MGVDLSAVMLREAMQNADAQKIEATYIDGVAEPDAVGNRGAARLTFVRCDMRQLKCDGEFDYAINIFTSFGYFVDEAENRRVLQGIRSALKPGGKLVIDVDNPLQYVRRRVGSTYVTVTGPDGEAREVSREEDFDGSRLRRVVRYRFDGERDPMYLECALYDRDALEGLLTECGFAVSEKIWGDFDGMRFSENSPRMIMVAERE
jgi:SAM-dependent methyltransferase